MNVEKTRVIKKIYHFDVTTTFPTQTEVYLLNFTCFHLTSITFPNHLKHHSHRTQLQCYKIFNTVANFQNKTNVLHLYDIIGSGSESKTVVFKSLIFLVSQKFSASTSMIVLKYFTKLVWWNQVKQKVLLVLFTVISQYANVYFPLKFINNINN